jgi:hypothetical protein
MQEIFLIAKITQKKFAESLLDGNVFTRPLAEFGSWNRLKNKDDATLCNNFRGDLREGVVHTFSNPLENKTIQKFPKEWQDVVKQAIEIDEDVKYFNIYSMYTLKYDKRNRKFKTPDYRMKQFGDTVVIIKDVDKFLKRLKNAIDVKFNENIFLADIMKYKRFNNTEILNPIYVNKEEKSWQSEFRIAIAQLDNDNTLSNYKFNILKQEVQNTFNIGDIRDIAISLSIDDFLNLNLPEDILESNNLKLCNKIQEETKHNLLQYVSTKQKLIFDI